MQAQSTVWKGGPLVNQPYSIATETEPHFLVSRCPISGTVNHTNFSDIFSWPGFNFIAPEYPPVPSFGYGLYKFSVNSGGGDAYFYIDYRDNRYTNYTYCNGHCADIWIKYDVTVDKFYYFSKGDSAIYPLSPNWRPIHKGQYLSIWQIKNQIPQGSPQTNQFPNYWQNCLVVIPKKASDGIEVPYLVWGPIPNFLPTGYKIYCSINMQGGPPGNFSLLAQVDANTTEYMDEGLAVGRGWKVYYKVKAFNNTNESGFTNTAEIGVSGFYKNYSNDSVEKCNFNLYSNYPNPFNPTTIIKYQLPEDAHVMLNIYDLLGREVTTLVNEVKKVGNYEVEFNGSKLPSGIYFYQLKVYPVVVGAGYPKGQAFIQTQKAILMK